MNHIKQIAYGEGKRKVDLEKPAVRKIRPDPLKFNFPLFLLRDQTSQEKRIINL